MPRPSALRSPTDFRAQERVSEKRRLSRERAPVCSEPLGVAASSPARAGVGFPRPGILTGFPFTGWRPLREKGAGVKPLGPRLGTAHSRPIAVHAKPCSTSVHKGHTRVVATSTKICTRGGSTTLHSEASAPPPRPLTPGPVLFEGQGGACEARFSAILFQGCKVRQVSCYTLLGGFRLPWPPSCCLNSTTPFLGSVSGHSGS